LKSHSPRAFERAENSFEDRGPTTYFQDARARYAVLKVPAETNLVSPAAVLPTRSRAQRNRHPICRRTSDTARPKGVTEAASSKQSSENRAHDVSVVPATARLHVELRRAPQLAGAPGSRWCRETRRPVLDVGTSRRSKDIRLRTGQCVP